MKKYLVVLAAAVLALASCGGQKGNKYTQISFKQTELTLSLGATDKLVVLYEPSELAAPAVTWATTGTAWLPRPIWSSVPCPAIN